MSTPSEATPPPSKPLCASDNLEPQHQDTEASDIWGYLVPTGQIFGRRVALKKRSPSDNSTASLAQESDSPDHEAEAEHEGAGNQQWQNNPLDGMSRGGYLIGRHGECDRIIDLPTVSNRHCLVFCENHEGSVVGMIEDLSTNGTYINDALIKRNHGKELRSDDIISISESDLFTFQYASSRKAHRFAQEYELGKEIGRGRFAATHVCVQKSSGMLFAAKRFSRKSNPTLSTRPNWLQREIGVLMALDHPNLLCLQDAFFDDEGVYFVLELARGGDLFNWVVSNKKATETVGRRIFVQLFKAVKYMHDRNIIHRDIKLENILIMDKQLHIKLADFGLSQIIGEEQFSRAVCGTPSYLAPELLSSGKSKRYSRAVDIWSAGVSLYICLCGFPPFSDELFSDEYPYKQEDQIRQGYFKYPSPYWDSVGDSALDMIDGMLTVDPHERFSISNCLSHSWVTAGVLEGLYGKEYLELDEASNNHALQEPSKGPGMESVLTSKSRNHSPRRSKLARERTLLSPSNREILPRANLDLTVSFKDLVQNSNPS